MIFRRLKKRHKAEKNDLLEEGLAVFAPMDGEMTPLAYIDDPEFSKDMAGQGVSIRPTGNRVASPVAGTVVKVYDRGRAIELTASDGVKILIYVGNDTANLKKKHFKACVLQGDIVGPGDKLIEFDREGIEAGGADTVTRFFICDNDKYDAFEAPEVRTVKERELITVLSWRNPEELE